MWGSEKAPKIVSLGQTKAVNQYHSCEVGPASSKVWLSRNESPHTSSEGRREVLASKYLLGCVCLGVVV